MKIPRNLFEIACRHCKKSGVRNAEKKFKIPACSFRAFLLVNFFKRIYAVRGTHSNDTPIALAVWMSVPIRSLRWRDGEAKMEAGNSVTCKRGGKGGASRGSTGRSRGSLEVIILTRYPVSTSVGNAWEVKTSLSTCNDHKCLRFIAELALRECYFYYWIFLTRALGYYNTFTAEFTRSFNS